MKRFSDVILVTDLDDSLLTRDKRITEKDLEAIKYFVSEGGGFSVATGRVYSSAKQYTDLLPITLPIILYNGAVVYDIKNGKTLYKELLIPSGVNYANEILAKFPELGCEIVCDNKVFIYRECKTLDEKMALENIEFGYCDENSIPDEIIKILIVGTNEQISAAYPEIKKMNFGGVDFMLSAPYYCEMLPSGASKAVGVAKMTEIVGQSNKKVAALGDFDNDIEMIKRADFGACVPNSPQRVKDVADIVLTKTSNDGAIAELIEFISNKFKEEK